MIQCSVFDAQKKSKQLLVFVKTFCGDFQTSIEEMKERIAKGHETLKDEQEQIKTMILKYVSMK